MQKPTLVVLTIVRVMGRGTGDGRAEALADWQHQKERRGGCLQCGSEGGSLLLRSVIQARARQKF